MRKIFVLLSLLWCVYGCWGGRQNVKETDAYPEIFPDYQFVTVPVNIAPLNFGVPGAERLEVVFRKGDTDILEVKGNGSFDISLEKWHEMLGMAKEGFLSVKVYARKAGEWNGYKPFRISVSADSIDPYMAYRLIEPGYEVGTRLSLYQRELSSFKEEAFVPCQLVDNSCVNCHSFCNYSPDRFMFHVRQKYNGTIIVEDGKARKIDTKTPRTISPGAYRTWHPSGNYIAFSNNQTHQAFHALPEKRIEVYDLESDLMIYDVKNNKVLTDQRFLTKESWETFPAWSPDGKYLYFCQAEPKAMPMEYKDLKYGIYRVAFDEKTGRLGDSIEAVVTPENNHKSTVFPTFSPDGRYCLYTLADGGTFPIHHKEADLGMLDLTTGQVVDIRAINSDFSDSYHAWSSSGRWIVFSSRRTDGSYTRPYFAYFDRDGKVHKPFVLPQRKPDFYKLFLKSFNVPEFIKGPVTVSPYYLEEVIKGKAINAQ